MINLFTNLYILHYNLLYSIIYNKIFYVIYLNNKCFNYYILINSINKLIIHYLDTGRIGSYAFHCKKFNGASGFVPRILLIFPYIYVVILGTIDKAFNES